MAIKLWNSLGSQNWDKCCRWAEVIIMVDNEKLFSAMLCNKCLIYSILSNSKTTIWKQEWPGKLSLKIPFLPPSRRCCAHTQLPVGMGSNRGAIGHSSPSWSIVPRSLQVSPESTPLQDTDRTEEPSPNILLQVSCILYGAFSGQGAQR